jgi:hypothetical protein
MTVLDIPYVSQIEEGGKKFFNDCGAASGVMLIHAYTRDTSLTVDEFYDQTGQKVDEYLHVNQIMAVLNDYNIKTKWRTSLTVDDLILFIEGKRPPIVLYNYKIIRSKGISTEIPFSGSHFAVVVGIDYFFAYLNDPLWTKEGGKNLKIPLEVWIEAWEKFPFGKDGVPVNPPRGALIPDYAVGSAKIPSLDLDPAMEKRMRVIYPKGMNVREGPSVEHLIVDSRRHGDIVTVLDTKSEGDDLWGCLGYNRWIAIEFNGNTYLVDEFPGGTTKPEEFKTVEVVYTGGLNVRSGPEIHYPIIDALLKGERVKVYKIEKVNEDEWGRIGIDQWIALRYRGEELAKII